MTLFSLLALSIALGALPVRASEFACQGTTTRPDVLVRRTPFEANSLNQVGFNHQDLDQPWAEPLIISTAQALSPAVLRYPGGTVSSYWDHRADTLLRDIDDVEPGATPWVDSSLVESFAGDLIRSEPTGNALEYFSVAQAEAGFEPVYVLNMVTPGQDYYSAAWDRAVDAHPGTPDLEDDWWLMLEDRADRALDMLTRARDLGLPVNLVELGNEYYFMQDYMAETLQPVSAGGANSAAEAYALAANYFASRVRAEFPSARIAAIGADARESDGELRKRWNAELLEHIDSALIDAATLHIYIETGIDTVSGHDDLLAMVDAWQAEWDTRYAESQLELLDSSGLEVWVTELSSNFYSPEVNTTWANALVNLFGINTLGVEAGYEMVAMQQLRLAYSSDTYESTNLGAVTRVWQAATQDAMRRADLEFFNTRPGVDGRYAERVHGSIFRTNSGKETALLLNLQDRDIHLDISRLRMETADCESLYAAELVATGHESVTATVSGPSVTLPAMSVVLLSTSR